MPARPAPAPAQLTTAPAAASAPAPATAPANGTPDAKDSRAPSRLGFIRFTPPADWFADSSPGRDAKVLVSSDSTADKPVAVFILLTKPAPGAFDFRARFNKAVETTAGGAPLTERGDVTAARNRQGYETLSQEFAFRKGPDDTVFGKLVAAKVGELASPSSAISPPAVTFTSSTRRTWPGC